MSVKALLGIKREMSQIFDESGRVIPVTIVEAGPCFVAQVKSETEKEGYNAVQIAFGACREVTISKPEIGHLAKNNIAPMKHLKEYRSDKAFDGISAGDTLTVEVFAVGDVVDVQGQSKGRGFQGGIKRHNFNSGPRGHGSKNVREPGSTGMNTTPGRVLKGKRMPGHMGAEQKTIRNLKVVRVDAPRNLLYLRGAVPGFNGALVFVREAISGSRRKGDKANWGKA